MGEPSKNPSVFDEPHLRPPPPPPQPFLSYALPDTPDVRQIDAAQDIRNEPLYTGAMRPTVEHSVWDEPALSHELSPLAAAAPDQLTYARWLADGRQRWGAKRSWGLALLIALAAGPWAIFGAFFNSGQSFFGGVMLIFVAPVTEELMKIAGITLAIEKAPYVVRSGGQILLCALAGGLAFAAIENLMYLNVYVPNPSDTLVVWRWTVCVALHTGCSLIAGIGVLRVWQQVWSTRTPPRLALAYPFLVAAAVIHGLYNAAAWMLELSGGVTW